MGYNPNEPATWATAELLQYAQLHGIDVPSGCEKSELVALVREAFDNEKRVQVTRQEYASKSASMENILSEEAASILQHIPKRIYNGVLRRHPRKLQGIIEAGIEQLRYISVVARLCSAQVQPPVAAWLLALASDDETGRTLESVLVNARGREAAVSQTCGRFCSDHDMVVRCLDCGTDTTCVLCMDCFRHSPCINHRFRISSSSGGAMCDCGDPTAWKPESFCQRHRSPPAIVPVGDNGSNELASPLDALAEEDRAWVEVVLRGCIQYIAMTLLQQVRLCALKQKAQARAENRRWAATCSNTTADSLVSSPSDEEAVLLDNIVRALGQYDWVGDCISSVTQRLWEVMQASEVAKYMVAELWAEPVRFTSSDSTDDATGTVDTPTGDEILDALPPHFSCVHMVFLYQSSVSAAGSGGVMGREAAPGFWNDSLIRSVGHCVSIPKFRFHVGGLIAAYAEYIYKEDYLTSKRECLSAYQIHVLTNRDVLRHLMMPRHLPYRGARDTVLHRMLSSACYVMWLVRDTDAANAVTTTRALSRDGLLFIQHQFEDPPFSSVSALQSCLACSPEACYTLVINRLAWRALVQLSGSIGISGYVFRNPNAPTESRHYPMPDVSSRALSRSTWLYVHAIREVLSGLLQLPSSEGRQGARSDPPPLGDHLMTFLKLPTELWAAWRAAVEFDEPPDRLRREEGLHHMLAACRVSNAEDEALLILPQAGSLAAVQARVLRRRWPSSMPGDDIHKQLAPDQERPMATSAWEAAMGYVVQLLLEMGRTLDVVFRKQRDGFCCGCSTVVLERVRDPTAKWSRGAWVTADGDGDGDRGTTPTTTTTASQGMYTNEEDEAEERAAPAASPLAASLDVIDYNLLEPSLHATTFSNNVPRLFGAVLTAWVIQSKREAERSGEQPSTARIFGLPGDGVGGTAATASAERPLRAVLEAFFELRAELAHPHSHPQQDRLRFCHQLLDALVMPQVLCGQVLDGLWRRGDYDVTSLVSTYWSFARGVYAELDLLMLQVLTMLLPPADMTMQMLQRFSYAMRDVSYTKKRQKERFGETGGAPPTQPERQQYQSFTTAPYSAAFPHRLSGYQHFLRCIITLVTDTSRSAFAAPLSSAAVERVVANVLALGKSSHSSILKAVSETMRGGDYGEADEDERDSSGDVIKFSALVEIAIHKLATAEDSPNGKRFRLRDTATWRSHVHLYHVGAVNSHFKVFHDAYRHIVTATAADQVERDSVNTASRGSKRHTALPPTCLDDASMYTELLPPTRALLHTNAVLHTALFVLHQHISTQLTTAPEGAVPTAATPSSLAGGPLATTAPTPQVAESGSRASDEDVSEDSEPSESASDSNSEDDDRTTPSVSREALLHAITTLYLCVQDCASISRAMRSVVGDDTEAANEIETGKRCDISWKLVELYLNRSGVNTVSFSHTSCAPWLPLPELGEAPTLKAKLQVPVMIIIPATSSTAAHKGRSTLAAMLHRLRDFLLSSTEMDPYGCLEMVEAVLVETGLATFDTASQEAEQKAKATAAQSRMELIQARQAMLMRRMRSHALKSLERAAPSTTAALAATPAIALEGSSRSPPCTTQQSSEGSLSSSTINVTSLEKPAKTSADVVLSSLPAKLLIELTTVDCCVCRSATSECLLLFCHTSTSGVLHQLGSVQLPDGRQVHNHVSMCGHAAHKSCVEKTFVRLSMLWRQWNFQSQLYLGPTEFTCPVCATIVTTVCPMPSLPGSSSGGDGNVEDWASLGSPTTRKAAAVAGVSLFEELQNGTTGSARTVAAEFCMALANAAVGLSPSEDIPAIVAYEDALQQRRPKAWALSETIRAFCYGCHLHLEAVKAGQPLSHRHLLGLLSILLSVTPNDLQGERDHLRANYSRHVQDKESLLVLEALLRVRDAGQLIEKHVLVGVLPALPQEYMPRLAASVSCEEGDVGDATRAAAAATLDTDFPSLTVSLWKVLGVLTILKVLLVEDAPHSIILSSTSLTLGGTVDFTQLSGVSIATPAARSAAVLHMLQYLLPVRHTGVCEALDVVAQDVMACVRGVGCSPNAGAPTSWLVTPVAAFTNQATWTAQVAETVLHLPSRYTTVLTELAARPLCTICHTKPTKPVMCCRCGQLMCLEPTSEAPELYRHTRACSGAVGIFLVVRASIFYVLELTSGRLYRCLSNYTDEYGERDTDLRRGVPLLRHPEETRKLVLLWLLNAWGATSIIFKTSHRLDLTSL